jgi:hypothetical protein
MSQTTDFTAELFEAANRLDVVSPFERRRLIERAVTVIGAQRELLKLRGNVVPLEPDFLKEMGKLAEMAGGDNGVDVLISVGLLMLAEEIRRLRILCQTTGADGYQA